MWKLKSLLHARHATSDGVSKAIKNVPLYCKISSKNKFNSLLSADPIHVSSIVVLPGVVVANSHHHDTEDGLDDGVTEKWQIKSQHEFNFVK